MKNLIKKSNVQNNIFCNKFSAVSISNAQQKMLKGGDGDSTEVIIGEDLIQG